MKRTSRGNIISGVLSLVAAMGGQLEGRVRLQKAAYLLRGVGLDDFRGVSFRYHYYGPYSRALSDALQNAIASDLLREERLEYGEEQSKYTYEITDFGRALLEENAGSDDTRLQQIAPFFRDVHWRVLELAATALFVEQDEHLPDRGTAMDHALALKPACTEHRAAAEALLASIGL